ncbi:HEAT repeat domain-containing protein [Dactylosporangium sp. NPDC006015]|uniref:HEAT repeat domain-containing protein n=1 Tax=Dactylosporangium sp. NPDC006015 TaxID=3154576 RepID=UPI0033BACC13
MGLAKARRIAARAHRGQLFAGGGLLTGHLERVDRILAGSGTAADATVRQAAWLHLVSGRGVSAVDLARAGVPPHVVHLVEAMSWRPWDDRARFTERLVRTPGAAAIRYAVLTDLHDHLAGQHAYEWWREQHVRLADALGLAHPPDPAGKTVLPEPPGKDGHLGGYARRLGALGTDEALTTLLAAYEAEKAGPARSCCLSALRPGVYAIATRPETASRRLAVAWWDSADSWERMVAVMTQVASGEPVDSDRLLDIVERETGWLAVAAIRGLTGPAGDRELRLLSAAAATARPENRWVRRAAVARLRAVGGPAAGAALHGRFLDPYEPPWRDDPGWLTEYGAGHVAFFIEKTTDPAWAESAPHALGELRAVEAVPALCRMAREARWVPTALITALGKIGAPDAVPALTDLAGHARADVRDHSLRALAHIDDPRVPDVALAACDDPDPAVRDRAARLLTRTGDRRHVGGLIRLCDTAHAGRAAAVLGRIGDPAAVPTLRHVFLTSPDAAVWRAAGRALATIPDAARHWYGVPGGDIFRQRAYIWILGHQQGSEVRHQLAGALTHEDPGMRANAAAAVARRADRDHLPAVRALLDDPAPQVRAKAAAALRALADPAARDRLEALRSSDPDPRVRSAASAAGRADPDR